MPFPKNLWITALSGAGLQLYYTAALVSSLSLLIKWGHFMKSHYEVAIYCAVIAGALGAGESLVSLLYWTPGSLLDIRYTKEASVPPERF